MADDYILIEYKDSYTSRCPEDLNMEQDYIIT